VELKDNQQHVTYKHLAVSCPPPGRHRKPYHRPRVTYLVETIGVTCMDGVRECVDESMHGVMPTVTDHCHILEVNSL